MGRPSLAQRLRIGERGGAGHGGRRAWPWSRGGRRGRSLRWRLPRRSGVGRGLTSPRRGPARTPGTVRRRARATQRLARAAWRAGRLVRRSRPPARPRRSGPTRAVRSHRRWPTRGHLDLRQALQHVHVCDGLVIRVARENLLDLVEIPLATRKRGHGMCERHAGPGSVSAGSFGADASLPFSARVPSSAGRPGTPAWWAWSAIGSLPSPMADPHPRFEPVCPRSRPSPVFFRPAKKAACRDRRRRRKYRRATLA